MKIRIALAVAAIFSAGIVWDAEANTLNPYRWVNTNNGVPVIQEQDEGRQYLSVTSCGFGDGDFRALTLYDGAARYIPDRVYREIQVRVDKGEIYKFYEVEIEPFSTGIKANIPLDSSLLADMIGGIVMRVRYGNDIIERYNLEGFTRSLNNAVIPNWCREFERDNEYFREPSDRDYFDV